jgi:predicted porin
MDDNIALDGGAWADGAQLTRLAAQYKLSRWTFGALWQKYDDDALVDDSAMVLNAAFKLNDSDTLKLQHASSDIVGASTQLKSQNGKQITLGYDHLLAKNVSLYAFYSKQSQDLDDTDRRYLAGGIEVKF